MSANPREETSMVSQVSKKLTAIKNGFSDEFKSYKFLSLVLNLQKFENSYQAILVGMIYFSASSLFATIFQPLAYFAALIAFIIALSYLFQLCSEYKNSHSLNQKLLLETALCFGASLALNFMPVLLTIACFVAIIYKSFNLLPEKYQTGLTDAMNVAKTYCPTFK